MYFHATSTLTSSGISGAGPSPFQPNARSHWRRYSLSSSLCFSPGQRAFHRCPRTSSGSNPGMDLIHEEQLAIALPELVLGVHEDQPIGRRDLGPPAEKAREASSMRFQVPRDDP